MSGRPHAQTVDDIDPVFGGHVFFAFEEAALSRIFAANDVDLVIEEGDCEIDSFGIEFPDGFEFAVVVLLNAIAFFESLSDEVEAVFFWVKYRSYFAFPLEFVPLDVDVANVGGHG